MRWSLSRALGRAHIDEFALTLFIASDSASAGERLSKLLSLEIESLVVHGVHDAEFELRPSDKEPRRVRAAHLAISDATLFVRDARQPAHLYAHDVVHNAEVLDDEIGQVSSSLTRVWNSSYS